MRNLSLQKKAVIVSRDVLNQPR